MKKHRFLALAFALCGLAALHAQTDITFTVEATVPPVYRLESNVPDATPLDLVNSDGTQIGNIQVVTNVSGAWTITISSSNGGQLAGTTPGNADRYPYSLSFGGISGIDLSSNFIYTFNTSARGLASFPVAVNYTRVDNLGRPVFADTYKDTIRITIAMP